MKPARILVAEEKSVLEKVCRALAEYDLLEATSLTQAHHLVLEDGIDLFLIGIHLDDSQAIPLVKFIRSERRHKKTPIIMLRLLPSDYAEMLRSTLDSMNAIHGISDYLELEDDDPAQAAKKIRIAVERCLPAEKRI